MSPHRDLDVLDLANMVADEVNQLLDAPGSRLLHRAQLRDAAQGVPANISEGFAKDEGPDRNKSLRVAKGEAEETISHLRSSMKAGRLDMKVFFRLRDRCSTVVKMLNALLS